MKELVEVIAKSLVDFPEEVTVTEKTSNNSLIIELRLLPAIWVRYRETGANCKVYSFCCKSGSFKRQQKGYC
jgi:hypothetical protein